VTENLEAEAGAVAETGAAAETVAGVEIVTGVGTEVAVETGGVGIKGILTILLPVPSLFCYQYPMLRIRIRSDRHLLAGVAGYEFGSGSRDWRSGSGPQTGFDHLEYFSMKV